MLSVVAVLILSVVICSATFLVRTVDAYSYYMNGDTDECKKRVVSAAGVERNSSIFLVDEAEIKRRVESKYPDINVINVKRSFPDKVTINFVRHELLFQVLTEGAQGGEYYRCYSSCRVGESAQEELNGLVTVKPAGEISTGIGSYIQGGSGYDRKMLEVFTKFMYGKGWVDSSITQIVDFIDFRRDGYVYIKMVPGCCIEIKGDARAFKDCLEKAFGAYVNSELAGGSHTCGRYFASETSDNVTYTPPGVGSYTSDEEYYRTYYENAAK